MAKAKVLKNGTKIVVTTTNGLVVTKGMKGVIRGQSPIAGMYAVEFPARLIGPKGGHSCSDNGKTFVPSYRGWWLRADEFKVVKK